MLGSAGNAGVSDPLVFTTTNRGHSPEEMAEMAMNKIMVVSQDAPSFIRDQALAHREKLKNVLVVYMNRMAQSERTTIWALLKKQGHDDLADIIRRL
jgi:hypothetical protein|tara:strand:+ start:2274 stop:2564 length:291 start_codon:yes stop_codon:yes gene_type:complete